MNEPKWHGNSKFMPTIWRFIEANPGCATCDIVRGTGVRRWAVDDGIRRMIAKGQVHISGYQRYEKTGSGMARQYTVGPGKNLPRPKIPVSEQKAKQYERIKLNKRRKTIAKQTAANGAFGFMVAQMKYAS